MSYDHRPPWEIHGEEEWEQRCDMFEEPGSNSALRKATPSNPRNLPCPTCGEPNKLTPADQQQGYQCNQCADRDEGRNFGSSDY